MRFDVHNGIKSMPYVIPMTADVRRPINRPNYSSHPRTKCIYRKNLQPMHIHRQRLRNVVDPSHQMHSLFSKQNSKNIILCETEAIELKSYVNVDNTSARGSICCQHREFIC